MIVLLFLTCLQTKEILQRFDDENKQVQLDISFYDTTRNAETKKRREELEKRTKYTLVPATYTQY